MGNWGDDTDPEVKALKEYNGRFTVNFKKIYMDVDAVIEQTLEVNEKHPKDSLLKLFFGTMTGFFVLFALSYQIVFLVTVPFMAFYLVALFRIGKAWKTFNYSSAQFIIMSIISLVAVFALGMLLQHVFVTYIF